MTDDIFEEIVEIISGDERLIEIVRRHAESFKEVPLKYREADPTEREKRIVKTIHIRVPYSPSPYTHIYYVNQDYPLSYIEKRIEVFAGKAGFYPDTLLLDGTVLRLIDKERIKDEIDILVDILIKKVQKIGSIIVEPHLVMPFPLSSDDVEFIRNKVKATTDKLVGRITTTYTGEIKEEL